MADYTLRGTLANKLNLKGQLSNATLRGMAVQIRLNENSVLQWRYEDEDDTKWRDLIDFSAVEYASDYELLDNLPTLNGVELTGELSELFVLPADEVTEQELMNLLND